MQLNLQIVEDALLAGATSRIESKSKSSKPQTDESDTEQPVVCNSPESGNLQFVSSSKTIATDIKPKYTSASTQVIPDMIS